MKLNPAICVLAVLLALTVTFIWAVYPDAPDTSPSTSQIKAKAKEISPAQAQHARIAKHAESWALTPSYEADFNALDPSYKVAAVSDSLFDPQDDYWGLPRDDKGAYELVDAYCTACHSASIVMQQRATPERWKELLIWMEDTQGMAKLPAEDETLVLDYISTHFSTQ